jgi:uncharacterized membrane protein YphA (DoxX/SURF4 family)
MESVRLATVDALLARALGAVFLFAAGWKLVDLAAFEETVARFGIVLDAWVGAAARAVLLAEVLVGLGLVLGLPSARLGALALTLLFLGVLAYGLHLGLDVDCGCFGPGEGVGLAQALRRDLVLAAVAGYLYWRRPGRRKDVSR